MKTGLPGVALIFLAIYTIVRGLSVHRSADTGMRELSRGTLFTIFSLVLAGATVAFFGKMQPMFFAILGYGGAIANYLATSENHLPTTTEMEEKAPRRHFGYSRSLTVSSRPGDREIAPLHAGPLRIDEGNNKRSRRFTRGRE
jgi:hypothetical protein